jgi:hypothetical protein
VGERRERGMSGARLLPDFIIGGAPRSGTTFLCHALEHNPAVFLAKPYIPEPKVLVVPGRSPRACVERYGALFASARSGQVLGEKTSYYLESAQACGLMKQVAPRAKILFIVREPVARAYSNYLWSRRNGLERLPFEEALALEGRRADPLPPEKSYARPFSYLERGNYGCFARRYYEAFGREQVRFFLYEDIERAPERLLEEIQRFIGVDPLPFQALDAGMVNAARDTGPALDPALAERLRHEMRPKVREFATLTALDVSAWGYDA